jgi:hypothetical protein
MKKSALQQNELVRCIRRYQDYSRGLAKLGKRQSFAGTWRQIFQAHRTLRLDLSGPNDKSKRIGLIGTALSKKISVFQSSSLKLVPITPNASYPASKIVMSCATVRSGNHHLWLLSALCAHTKTPYKPDLLWRTPRSLNGPGRARTDGRRELLDHAAPRAWGSVASSLQKETYRIC